MHPSVTSATTLPAERPSLWPAALFCVAFGLVVSVLSLSDQAPSVIKALASDFASVFRQVEARTPVEVSRPAWRFDQVGHGIVWGFGMLGAGLLARGRVWLPLIAASMLASSIVFEYLQATLTATRTMSSADAWGNAVGIAIATVAVLLIRAAVWTSRRLKRAVSSLL